MGIRQAVGEFKQLQSDLTELVANERREEEVSSFEVADSARSFSRRAKEVVDDKLTFSATLMRAGEVDAANRLLAEVHDEVRSEEVALLEKVNEVRAARAVQRDRITRLRLARLLAVAVLGSSLLGASAIGMAVAGMLNREADAAAHKRAAVAASALPVAAEKAQARRAQRRPVRFGDVRLMLTSGQLKTIKKLAGGSVDEVELQGLLDVLPAPLAQKVEAALGTIATTSTATVKDAASKTVAQDVPRLTTKVTKKIRRRAKPKRRAAAQEQPRNEPSPQPSEEPAPEDDSSEDDSSDGRSTNDGEDDDIFPLDD